jgi:UDP-2,3-diacylglucosamine hydrolase
MSRDCIGLIAGNGSLPLSLVREAKSNGLRVVAAGHRGESNSELADLVDSFIWVKVGQLNKIISFFKREDVSKVTLLGGINRIRLLGGISLDRRSIKLIANLKSLRDDALLKGVAAEFVKEGWEIISPFSILKSCLAVSGFLTDPIKFSESELSDVKLGWSVAKELGRLDVGQAVVVGEGLVLGVEAIEGTDNLLLRVASILSNNQRRFKGHSTLVKLSKPQQDLKLDLPTIGLQTLVNMSKSNCRNLVIEAGKTCLVDPVAISREAARLGIRIVAYASFEDIVNPI